MSRSFTAADPDRITGGEPAGTDIDLGTSWTIAVWIKPNGIANGKFFCRWNDATAGWFWLFELGSSGQLTAAVGYGGSNTVITSANGTIADATWSLCILEQSGTGAGSLQLYVGQAGGSLSSVASGSPSGTPVAGGFDSILKFGAGGGNSNHEAPYNGLISRGAVWNATALSSGQRTALLTTDPSGVDTPTFYAISAVNEVVDYAGGASLTDNGSTYSTDEPFSGGGGGGGNPWYYYANL
jgi:hypothetical protein